MLIAVQIYCLLKQRLCLQMEFSYEHMFLVYVYIFVMKNCIRMFFHCKKNQTSHLDEKKNYAHSSEDSFFFQKKNKFEMRMFLGIRL